MFGLGECGELITINLNQDISRGLAMLRGIDFGRRNPKNDIKIIPCIVKVIFNDPATIVFWSDGSKTVVKAANEPFDPEKGLAMAVSKKHFGNEGNYYNVFKHWLPKGE